MKIKDWMNKVTVKVGMEIAKKISPVIKDAIDNPENLKFEGHLEGDEIVVRIKRKES